MRVAVSELRAYHCVMNWSVIISVEHASNHVPNGIDLGVDPDVLDSHVAWDPGTAVIGEMLGRDLDAPVLLGSLTRLVVDLNRSPTNPDSIPDVAFGVPVPGNQRLDDAGRAARLAEYHTPYWKKAREWVRTRSKDRTLLHLSIHSFTPVLHGELRSMSVGVMYDPARPLELPFAESLIDALRARGIDTANNGPYDGRNDALVTTLRQEFPPDRYAGIQIEHNLKHIPEMEALGREVLAGLRQVLRREG